MAQRRVVSLLRSGAHGICSELCFLQTFRSCREVMQLQGSSMGNAAFWTLNLVYLAVASQLPEKATASWTVATLLIYRAEILISGQFCGPEQMQICYRS